MKHPFAALALLVSSIGLSLGCEGELSAGSTEPPQLPPAGFEVISREESMRSAKMSTTYPQMTGPRSAARDEMNQKIESAFLDGYQSYRDYAFTLLVPMIKEADAGGRSIGCTDFFFLDLWYEIGLLSTDLVSIVGESYANGGASNHHTFFTVNYHWNEGHAEEFHLVDLFDASLDWRTEFISIVRRALAEARASDREGWPMISDERLLKAHFTLSPVEIVLHSKEIRDLDLPYSISIPLVQFDHLLAHNDLVSLWHD
jgi:hypothetical protein